MPSNTKTSFSTLHVHFENELHPRRSPTLSTLFEDPPLFQGDMHRWKGYYTCTANSATTLGNPNPTNMNTTARTYVPYKQVSYFHVGTPNLKRKKPKKIYDIPYPHGNKSFGVPIRNFRVMNVGTWERSLGIGKVREQHTVFMVACVLPTAPHSFIRALHFQPSVACLPACPFANLSHSHSCQPAFTADTLLETESLCASNESILAWIGIRSTENGVVSSVFINELQNWWLSPDFLLRHTLGKCLD